MIIGGVGGGVLLKLFMFCVFDCCLFRILVSGVVFVRFGLVLILMVVLVCVVW